MGRDFEERWGEAPDDEDALLRAAYGHRATEPAEDEESPIAGERYRIERELGRGGQGVVYLAEDRRLGRLVALKMLTTHGKAGAWLRRFRREARVTSQLDHPAICAVYDSGTWEGVPFIAMQYVQGESLAARIGATPESSSPCVSLPWERGDDASGERLGAVDRVLRLLEQVALALHQAHEAGVVHRDIKPANLMVTADGSPIILDFGLASVVDHDEPTLTLTGEIFGTPAYMSPEQLARTHDLVDRRVDVWSLGVTLYECLTLQRPFDAPTRDALTRQILEDSAPDVRRVNRSVPRELGVVIETALEKDVARRYGSAKAFAEDLRRVRVREPVLARRAGAILRSRRWMQRNKAMTVGLCSLIIGLAVTGALWVENRAARGAAQENLAEWELLADHARLEALLRESRERLWPPTPEKIPAMDGWIARARSLLPRRAAHEAALSRLRRRAVAWSDDDRERDERQSTLRRAELQFWRDWGRELEERVRDAELRQGAFHDQVPMVRRQRTRILTEVGFWERKLAETRGTWRFADANEQWRHDQEVAYLDALDRFEKDDPTDETLASVLERRRFARDVLRLRSVHDREAWERARQGVAADPRYRGLELAPQAGLVPLGPDPDSGLQEFALLQSGAPPERHPETGRLITRMETALVFVLLPGGSFLMGEQGLDPDAPNYVREAMATASPVHEVELAPFLLSKYEMTQGQWHWVMGANPSGSPALVQRGRHAITVGNPVESVSYDECQEVARRLGCVLPTEARWEYACRAGTTTPFSTGADVKSLIGSSNVLDEGSRPYYSATRTMTPGRDDGHDGHAPVGSFEPNTWGFHDMHGNVWELCLDWGDYTNPPRTGDGHHAAGRAKVQCVRGGSYQNIALEARSGIRSRSAQGHRSHSTGFRPARDLDG